jgi:RNA binding exosome subunit
MNKRTQSSSVSRVELSSFAHATEEESKVIRAILNILPVEYREEAARSIYKTITHGYYGNPITILRIIISDEERSCNILAHLVSKLSEENFQFLISTVSERFDHGKLYLRVDKQKAYLGEISLSDRDDIIKIVVTLKPHIRSLPGIENYLMLLRRGIHR